VTEADATLQEAAAGPVGPDRQSARLRLRQRHSLTEGINPIDMDHRAIVPLPSPWCVSLPLSNSRRQVSAMTSALDGSWMKIQGRPNKERFQETPRSQKVQPNERAGASASRSALCPQRFENVQRWALLSTSVCALLPHTQKTKIEAKKVRSERRM